MKLEEFLSEKLDLEVKLEDARFMAGSLRRKLPPDEECIQHVLRSIRDAIEALQMLNVPF